MTHFCWVYKHSRDKKADELRLSIRSVLESFPNARITIAGDCPEWYNGHHIPTEFVLKPQYAEYHDTLNKLRAILDSPDVEEEFVWMMDDIYFVRPVTLDDLKVPRIDFNMVLPDTGWRRLKLRTQEYLVSHGYSSDDYATHLPHVVTKTNLRKMFEVIPFEQSMFLWEICYGNLFRSNPVNYEPFFFRILQKYRMEYFESLPEEIKVINNSTTGWTVNLLNWLYRKFPMRSKVEKPHEQR
jgi:hypothetical protein